MTNSGIRWRDGRSVAISPDDREVWLFGGEGPVRLAGLNAGPLARAIDGSGHVFDVVQRAVAEGMDSHTAERLITKWIAAGHVLDSPESEFTALRVQIIDSSPALTEALLSSGVHLVADKPDVIVKVTNDLVTLSSLNTDSTTPVIAVQLRGERALVTSPLGSQWGCQQCVASRIAVRRGMELVAARRSGLEFPPPSAVMHASSVSIAAGVIAAQLSNLQRGQVSHLQSDQAQFVVVIDPFEPRVERHQVVRVPGCAQCDPTGTSLVNSHLDGLGNSDGESLVDGAGLVGFRTRDPEETWLAHSHHISSVVGIVPVVELNGPAAMRSFVAGANVVGVDDPVIAASLFRNRGGGKGLTLSAARASALAEALERDALRARRDEFHRTARYSDIDGAIHPHSVQLFSETQMQLSAAAWLTGATPNGVSHPVPVPFREDQEHAWSPIRSLVTGELHWLPTSMMYIGWAPRGSGLPPACSNGVAAGNTIAEAQLQGLLELVERDAVALWWYPKSHRHRIDVESWDDPRVQAAVAPHVAAGSQVFVVDITTDLGIPAAVANVRDRRTGLLLTGAGAHTDPAIAVARAITEAAQMAAALAGADANDPHFRAYAEAAWDRSLTESDTNWVFGSGEATIPETPTYASVAEARDDVVSRIRDAGHDVLWADLTRRDVDLAVVRTFAPGLRHFWRRLAPGRLYDIPVAQGWVEQPFDEKSVNDLEMPI